MSLKISKNRQNRVTGKFTGKLSNKKYGKNYGKIKAKSNISPTNNSQASQKHKKY